MTDSRDIIRTILDTAIDLANRDGFPWYDRVSNDMRFSLAIKPTAPNPQEVHDRASYYVQKAILQHKRDFIALIVGHARKDDNFFDKLK